MLFVVDMLQDFKIFLFRYEVRMKVATSKQHLLKRSFLIIKLMPKAIMGSPKLLPQTSCPKQESYRDAGSCLVSISCMRPPAEPASTSGPLKEQDNLLARNQKQISDLGLKIKKLHFHSKTSVCSPKIGEWVFFYFHSA